jgi:hypothetical protein
MKIWDGLDLDKTSHKTNKNMEAKYIEVTLIKSKGESNEVSIKF